MIMQSHPSVLFIDGQKLEKKSDQQSRDRSIHPTSLLLSGLFKILEHSLGVAYNSEVCSQHDL